MGDEWYFHNQNILKFLKKYVEKFAKIDVRSRPYFDSWDFYKQLKDVSLKINVGFGHQSIENEMKKYSLIIGTNPSTTMFDILISKKPCIFFWDQNQAIKHLKTIIDDIPSWWNNKKRQKAIKNFLENYCTLNSNFLSIWENFLYKGKNK